MTDSGDTTPTADRNTATAREIAQDMQDRLGELDAYLNVLDRLTKDFDNPGRCLLDEQDKMAIRWTIGDIDRVFRKLNALHEKLWQHTAAAPQSPERVTSLRAIGPDEPA
jgi:hypothetical protein